MDRVARQVQLTQQVLATPDAEWSDVASALDELAQTIESIGLNESRSEVARLLLPISSELSVQITGFRSKLVGQVCAHVTRIVCVLQRDFRVLANELLSSLARTARGASTAVRQPGAQLFRTVTEHVRYDLALFHKVYVQAQHEKVRMLLLDQVALVLAHWTLDEVAPHYGDVVAIVERALRDPAQSVRSASRDVLCTLAALWEDRASDLVDLLSPPARDQLLKEKPLAALSQAVLAKYPELAQRTVVSRAAAASSSKGIGGKPRPAFQKSATSVCDTDPQVEIHVATPPPQAPKTRLAMISSDDDASGRSDASADMNGAVPRRLFQDADANDSGDASTSGVGDQTSDAGAAASVKPSGIPRLSPAKTTAVPPSSSALLTSPSSIPLPPGSTRHDIASQRLRTESRVPEGSKIPLLATRSPVPRRNSHTTTASTTQSHDAPFVPSTASPRSIARRASANTVVASTAGGTSTNSKRPPSPLRRAMSFATPSETTGPDREPHRTSTVVAGDQENRSAALNAPDAFLDKALPSSAPSPTPVRADSNVTVRARRKVIAHAISNAALRTSSIDSVDADNDSNAVPSRLTVEVPLNQLHSHEAPPVEPVADVTAAHAPVDSIDSLDYRSQRDAPVQQQQAGAASAAVAAAPLSPIREAASRTEVAASDTPVSTTDEPWPPSIALGSAVFAPEPQPTRTVDSIRDAPTRATADVTAAAAVAKDVAIAASTTSTRASRLEPAQSIVADRYLTTPATAAATEGAAVDLDVNVKDDSIVDSRDYVTTVATPTATDALPRNALENLIGIQKTMMTLQALTQVDVRGLPLKPRADRHGVAAVQQRPRSASRARFQAPECSPRTAQLLERWSDLDDSVGRDYDVDARSAFVAAPSSRDAEPADAHRALTVDRRFGATREQRDVVQRHDTQPRALRPTSARRRGATAFRSAPVDERPVERPVERPADQLPVSAQLSADAERERERERVEQQFQGLVRESMARRARPSAAMHQQQTSPAAAAPLQAAAGVAQTLEPPVHMTVKAATPLARAVPRPFASSHPDCSRQHHQQHRHRSSTSSWLSAYVGCFALLLAFVFGASGLLRAATTVRDSHDYHAALKLRIATFETSIADSYAAVRKLEEHYGVWSDYVRVLADEDEAHALALLETLQTEVAQWQRDLQRDLAQFKQALAVDVVDAALAPLLQNASRSTD